MYTERDAGHFEAEELATIREPRSIKSSLLSRSRDYCKCYTSTTFYVTMWMRMILLYFDVVGRGMTLMQVAYAYLRLTVLGWLSLEHM